MHARTPDRLEAIADVGLDQAIPLARHRRAQARPPAAPSSSSGRISATRESRSGRPAPAHRTGRRPARTLPAPPPASPPERSSSRTTSPGASRPWSISCSASRCSCSAPPPTPTPDAPSKMVLDAVWEASGGIACSRDTRLLGHVTATSISSSASRTRSSSSARSNPPSPPADATPSPASSASSPSSPGAASPSSTPTTTAALDAYVIHLERALNRAEPARHAVSRLARPRAHHPARRAAPGRPPKRRRETVTEVLRPRHASRLPRRPARPARVQRPPPRRRPRRPHPEPLPALPATRAWARSSPSSHSRTSSTPRSATAPAASPCPASRCTSPSACHGFEDAARRPGRVWSTDDLDASIEPFGGDAHSPSESEHVEQVREAMDKASGVLPWPGASSAPRSATSPAPTPCASRS